jgi:Fe-S-cluster containining protein
MEAQDKQAEGNSLDKSFCSDCDRRCCSAAVVLPDEMKAISRAAGMGFFQRRKVFQKRGDYYIIKGTSCPFLKDGLCSIEHVKPLNCRIFPLALTHQGKDAEWAISPECPSYSKVPREFVERAKELAKPLLDRHREKGPLV